MRKFMLFLALAIGVAGAIALFGSRNSSLTVVSTPVEKQYGPPKFIERPPQPAVSTPAAPGVSADIVRMLANSTNLKAFVEQAKQHPEKGGYAYAMTATSYCSSSREFVARMRSRVQSTGDSSQPTFNQRIAAVEELERRCQGFAPGESAIALYHEGLARGDVVLNTQVRLAEAKSLPFAEQAKVAREAMALRDPQVLSRLASFGAVMDEKLKEPVNYLDGKRFGGLSRRDYYTAWNVALCEFNQECDSPTTGPVLELCATGNRCLANGLELLRDDYRKHPERWQQIEQMAQRIAVIIDTQEVEALAPPVTRKSS